MLLGGEAQLLMCDPGSPYSYGAPFEKVLGSAGLSAGDVGKIKIWNSAYPKETDNGVCGIRSSHWPAGGWLPERQM